MYLVALFSNASISLSPATIPQASALQAPLKVLLTLQYPALFRSLYFLQPLQTPLAIIPL